MRASDAVVEADMTTTTHARVPDRSVLAWTGAIAAVWLVAAILRPGTTLHLGPFLLPLVPAILGSDSAHPVRFTLIGFVVGAASIALLSVSGNLDGPALEPFTDAIDESIALLVFGGAVGLIVSALAGRRTR